MSPKQQKLLAYISIWIAIVSGSGCSNLSLSNDPLAPAPGTAIYNYGWTLSNLSDHPIEEIQVFLESHGRRVPLEHLSFLLARPDGELGKGIIGTTFHVASTPLKVPDQVVVTWVAADGSPREQVVPLRGLVNPNNGDFMGRIWIRYGKDLRWRTIVLTNEQLRHLKSDDVADRDQSTE